MMHRNIISLFLSLSFIVILSGCSSGPKPLFVYGDYSEDYYASKKDNSPKSDLKFQKSIEYAIENSEKSRSGKVAPGMYANLGYIYLKSGNTQKAIDSFIKEKVEYPEATIFMDRMIQKTELLKGDADAK